MFDFSIGLVLETHILYLCHLWEMQMPNQEPHGFNFANFSHGAESHRRRANGSIVALANRTGFNLKERWFTKPKGKKVKCG